MQKSDKFKVLSLFSGCGGLDLGFKQAGFNIIWANEINIDACSTYRLNFPETNLVRKDIRLIKDREFPKNIDVLIGGYPCQGFSLGGKRKLNDKRNNLYKEYSRCLEITRPKCFLAENVKGLITIGNGKTFKQMIQDFTEKNYNVKYKIYNVKQLGVPQDRERIFLIGIRKDLNIDFQFPEPEYGPDLKSYIVLKDSIWYLRQNPGEFIKGDFTTRYMSRQRKRSWNQVSYCIMASAKQNPLHPDGKKMKKVAKDRFIFQGNINRRLSVLECLAIQTFPLDFKLSGNLVSKYKQIGNGVPPLIAKKIAIKIKKSLECFYSSDQMFNKTTLNESIDNNYKFKSCEIIDANFV